MFLDCGFGRAAEASMEARGVPAREAPREVDGEKAGVEWML